MPCTSRFSRVRDPQDPRGVPRAAEGDGDRRAASALERPALAIGALLLVAVTLRLLYLAQFSDNPWFLYTVNDERIYDRIAKLLVQGEPGWDRAFYQPPGYALFLSLLYAATERDLALVRLAQSLLGVVNVLLLYAIGRRVFGPVIGFVSALLFAVYAPMLFFEGMMLPPVLVVFLNLAFVLALLRWIERPRWWRGLATGLLLGASAATMSIILPFAAVVVLLVGRELARRSEWGPARRRALLSAGSAFTLGLAAPVAACTVHNWLVEEKLVLISDNLGINLYLGTGANFERKVRMRPGEEWAQLNIAPVRAGRDRDRSGYFVERSLQLIRSDPGTYAASLVRKLFLFAHGHELKRNQEIYPFRRYSTLLSGLLWKAGVAWPYGVLFPFAVLGMIHSLRERSFAATTLLLLCVSHVLLLLPFFVTARYRMNIVPFLLLFAVYGGSVLLRSAHAREWRTAAGCALVLIVFLTLCNWRVGEMSTEIDPDLYRTLAKDLRYEGRADEADALLAESVRSEPPPDPGEAISWRISGLLVAAGALALLGYRKLAGSGAQPDAPRSEPARAGPASS